MTRILAPLFAFAAALAGAAPGLAQAPAAPDAKAYERCAACHLPTGQGVPGAFPPLDSHIGRIAATPAGRTYLAMVVSAGLNGPIKVEGGDFAGAMPAQGLSAAETAGVLNYVLANFAKAAGAKPFSPAEVEAARQAHPGVDGARVAALRPPEAGRK